MEKLLYLNSAMRRRLSTEEVAHPSLQEGYTLSLDRRSAFGNRQVFLIWDLPLLRTSVTANEDCPGFSLPTLVRLFSSKANCKKPFFTGPTTFISSLTAFTRYPFESGFISRLTIIYFNPISINAFPKDYSHSGGEYSSEVL